MRVDRVIEAELLTAKPGTMRIGYSYRLNNETYKRKAAYKLDVVPSTRLTWVHQDRIGGETYTQPIQQVRSGDSLEFAMSLFTLEGVISGLEWDEPEFAVTPKVSFRDYNRDWARNIFATS